ncbi:restriction endonuclease subunit S [Lentilactobacillus sp. IMAU92037]|uniref:restriction endonuclease subunit S n=1 Tax=Lentilactobacillus dabitei TaxID=2831523 RepID=UPI001C2BEFAC|nr:restriction endonuclease subunit S [Lentilactobacillus dabitei]MBV0930254.1 restriction endonuclease subunit S [Lentilactobacillus dabitei]
MKDNQAKYPQLRFKGFTDPWEQRKVSELADRYDNLRVPITASERVAGETPYYGANGIQDYVEGFTHNGEFVLVAEDGANDLQNYPVQYVDGKVWVNNHAHVLQAKEERVDNKFLTNALKHTNIEPYLVGGGRAKLNADVMMKINFKVPTLPEQVQIGKFFDNLDHLITLHQRKLAKLKELKQGYLQKLFPKNGAKVPELRFAGFADAWEQRKFEYLLDENDGIRRGPFGSALKKECFVSQSDYVVYEQQNAIYNKYETRYNITKDKFEELKKFELKPEDFIMSGAGTIGRISRVPHGIDKGVFNQALIRFRIDNRITDSEYFLQFIRADFMQKKLTSTNPGSAITNLVPMSEVKKWGILVPQINEQSKIGIFFKQLDKTITLHQRKLEKLQELKKGYLQKMFC